MMRTAEIILFPNTPQPIVEMVQIWWARGYVISNRRGRGFRLKKVSP